MKTRLLFVLLLVASLAACGGGSVTVPANAIAVVGSVPITTADFNAYLKQAETVAAAQGPKPVPGTPQYTAMRNQVIGYLVQVNELDQQAMKENVSVSDAEVTTYIANLAKKAPYNGSMKKLTDALKTQGLTMDLAQKEVHTNLLAQKFHTKVTASAKVTLAEEQDYYHANIANYQTAAQTSRSVRHILVATRSLADTIEGQVTNANFARLAKKYSTDTGSASQGGKLTAVKGQLVKPFEDVAFSLKTGEISAPVKSTYGWHIIQALGPVQTTKAHTATFAEEEASVKAALLKPETDKLWQQWLDDLKKEWGPKVHYQSGYEPPATTALPTTTGDIPTTG